jgi:hypothetical protein
MVQLDADADISLPHDGRNGFWFSWSRPPKPFQRTTDAVDDGHGSYRYSNLAADNAYGWYQEPIPDSLKFDYVAGNPEEIALYRVRENESGNFPEQALIKDTQATSFLRSGKAKSDKVVEYLKSYQAAEEISPSQKYFEPPTGCVTDSISALAQATALYDQLPGATVSISVLNVSLREAKWRNCYHKRKRTHLGQLSRCGKFACIAMFESGNLNLDPDSITSVMAMSSGNSIFTLSALLQDPSISSSSLGEVTRILGNLNRPGIVVLVPPQDH